MTAHKKSFAFRDMSGATHKLSFVDATETGPLYFRLDTRIGIFVQKGETAESICSRLKEAVNAFYD